MSIRKKTLYFIAQVKLGTRHAILLEATFFHPQPNSFALEKFQYYFQKKKLFKFDSN